MQGATHFLAFPQTDPRLDVEIESIGDALPGGVNVIRARLTNTTPHTTQSRQRASPA